MNNSLNLEELLNRKEELHSDLKPYLVERNRLGQILQHPLIYEVPYASGMNALINARYQQKLYMLKKAREAGKWQQVITLFERPYRWDALVEISSRISVRELAQQFAWVWSDSENIWQNLEIIEELVSLLSQSDLKSELMDQNDFRRFQRLPSNLIVYRGCTLYNKEGLSWSLDIEKAKWFALRFNNKQPLLLTGQVDKSDVLFYTNQRGESEIVVPKHNCVKIASESIAV